MIETTKLVLTPSFVGDKLVVENDTNSYELNELHSMNESNRKIWNVPISSEIISVIATQTIVASFSVDNSLHSSELLSVFRLVPLLI